MFYPLLEGGGSWFINQNQADLYSRSATTLISLPKNKCLKTVKNRLEILYFIKQTHQARRPWINCSSTTPKDKWQYMYNRTAGAKSFYSLGLSVCKATDRMFSNLSEYCSYILAVLVYYEFCDSKKIQVESGTTNNEHLAPLSPTTPTTTSNEFSPFGNSPSIRNSISRKFSRAYSLTHSPSFNNNSPSLPSPPPEENETVNKTSYVYQPTIPSLHANPDLSNLHKTKLPSLLTKNTARMSVLKDLKTKSEEELAFYPDAYQSFISLLDTFIIIYLKIQEALDEHSLTFVELNEIEENLRIIDSIVRKYSTIEACNHIKHDHVFSYSVCRDPDVMENAVLSY